MRDYPVGRYARRRPMRRAGDRAVNGQRGVDGYVTISQWSEPLRCPRRTLSLVFGLQTTVWTIAGTRAGTSFWLVFEAAERSIVRWHEDEATLTREKPRIPYIGGVQGNGKGRRNGRKDTTFDESREERTDRAAWYQADHVLVDRACLCLRARSASGCGCLELYFV